MLFDVSPDHGRSHSFTHRANEVTCPPQLPGPKLSFKVIKSFKHQPGADALEYPHRLSYRTLRRNLNVEMDMILVYFYRLDIHAIFDGRPPQELLAVFSLMWERHHPLAIFRRPDDVILAFKNGVTASMKYHRSLISHAGKPRGPTPGTVDVSHHFMKQSLHNFTWSPPCLHQRRTPLRIHTAL